MAAPADPVVELDVAALVADMLPPSADDVPIARDGRVLDTPDKLIAYLKEINAERATSDQQRAS